jgi:hypothetical protein
MTEQTPVDPADDPATAADEMAFLPFAAINNFMRPDYRLEVVRYVLQHLATLTPPRRVAIDALTRQIVRVPGFRNSAKAPAGPKARPLAEATEKHSELMGLILASWAELHPELADRVHALLTGRGWDVLPAAADRLTLPGFLPTWPKDEDFDVLLAAYAEQFPDHPAADDDISLMVVWLSLRLPFEQEGD